MHVISIAIRSNIHCKAMPTIICARHQARWVWLILVSCSLFLTIAILAAVAAFAAAAFAVLPKHEYALAAVPLGFGACSVGSVLLWLVRSTWATKPSDMLPFLSRWLNAQSAAINASRHGGKTATLLPTDGGAKASLPPPTDGGVKEVDDAEDEEGDEDGDGKVDEDGDVEAGKTPNG